MRAVIWIFAAIVASGAWVGLAAPAHAQDLAIRPAADWVIPLEPVDSAPSPSDTGAEVIALDDQLRFGTNTVERYRLSRSRIRSEAGLSYLSTVSISWNPAQESVVVHQVRILRGDQVIDVLAQQTFETLRRETSLEASMLTGWLTATLQPRDLRVGDVLETAFTVVDTGGVLAPHREALAAANYQVPIGRYRLRASWPAARPVNVAGLAPWTNIQPRRVGDGWVYELQVDVLRPEFMPQDLPGRFSNIRTVQFTDHQTWGDIVRQMQPLYDRSATLEAGSPLMAEIERIRSAHDSDQARASAVLRLVQDEVRYLALSMGEGGYVPVSADEVWRSRFGDCKGKTVLLLALLRGLGLQADAAMVSTSNGDGLDARLPLVGWFDHVIVRLTLDGQVYWIDGAGRGDRNLAEVLAPPYVWALPVSPSSAGLEAIIQLPARSPNTEILVNIDVSAGLDADAAFRTETRFFGAMALAMREAAGHLSREQLQTQMAASSGQPNGVMTVFSVDTGYDEETNRFSLITEGTTRSSWVRSSNGRVLSLNEAAFDLLYAPEREGLVAAYADAPYRIAHPNAVRGIFRVTLPAGGEGFRLEANDRTFETGGNRYERRTTLLGGVVETMMSVKSQVPEVSAEAMAEARRRAERNDDVAPQIRAPVNYVATAADGAPEPPDGGEADDLVERAEALLGVGDAAEAITLMNTLLEREPESVAAMRTRGDARSFSEDYAGAEEDYARALAIDPADVEALIGQGLAAIADRRPADAVIPFSVVLRLEPANPTGLTGRGSAYYRLGNWARSLDDYRAAKAADGDLRVALQGELRALIRLDRLDEARTIALAVLENEPTDIVALDALIRLEKRAGRQSNALPALDAAVLALPEDASFLIRRGGVRARARDEAGAREDFGRARTLAAGLPALLNNLCWRQASNGFDLEQALADCDAALGSGRPYVVGSRAFVLLNLGRYDEARAAWSGVVEDAGLRASATFGMGLARLALGDEGGSADLAKARAWDVDVGESYDAFLERHPELDR